MPGLTVSTFEKNSYEYVYVDENNMVHLLCPTIRGETIGLDNTCQTTRELKKFFGLGKDNQGKSAVDILTRYREDLTIDIALLEGSADRDELQKKRARLQQVDQYIGCLNSTSKEIIRNLEITKSQPFGSYPSAIQAMLRRKSNCVSILLSPLQPDEDKYLNGVGSYIFSVGRGKSEVLGKDLRQSFSSVTQVASIRNRILENIQKKMGEKTREFDDKFVKTIIAALQAEIEQETGEKVDLSKSKTKHLERDEYPIINETYFTDTVFTYAKDDEIPPKELADSILAACLTDDFWRGLPSANHFKAAAALEDQEQRAEKTSILTQFFLAEVNVFCYVAGKSTADFGKILESGTNKALRQELAYIVTNALANNKSVEKSLIDFIDKNHTAFGLSHPISDEEAKQIIDRFKVEYRTIIDAPHFDEFILFLPDKKGDFVNYQNRISFHFSYFLEEIPGQMLSVEQRSFLTDRFNAFKTKSQNRLPPQNNIVLKTIAITDQELKSVLTNNPRSLLEHLDQLSDEVVKAIKSSDGWDLLQHQIAALTEEDPSLRSKFSRRFIWDPIEKFVQTHSWSSFDINTKDINGDNVLMWEVRNGHTAEVEAFLAAGFSVNTENKYGSTPLTLAAGKGDIATAKVLLAHGVNVNAINGFGDAALALAVSNDHPDMVSVLLENGADVDVRDANEDTPLILAARKGDVTAAKALLAHGANVNAINDRGKTALMEAASFDHADFVAELLGNEKVAQDIVDSMGNTALKIAIIKHNGNCAAVFLKKMAESNIKSLMMFIKKDINENECKVLKMLDENNIVEILKSCLSKGDPKAYAIATLASKLLKVQSPLILPKYLQAVFDWPVMWGWGGSSKRWGFEKYINELKILRDTNQTLYKDIDQVIQAGLVADLMTRYACLKENSSADLEQLKQELNANYDLTEFKSPIANAEAKSCVDFVCHRNLLPRYAAVKNLSEFIKNYQCIPPENLKEVLLDKDRSNILQTLKFDLGNERELGCKNLRILDKAHRIALLEYCFAIDEPQETAHKKAELLSAMLEIDDLFNPGLRTNPLVKEIAYEIYWAISPEGGYVPPRRIGVPYYQFEHLKDRLQSIKESLEQKRDTAYPIKLKQGIIEEVNALEASTPHKELGSRLKL